MFVSRENISKLQQLHIPNNAGRARFKTTTWNYFKTTENVPISAKFHVCADGGANRLHQACASDRASYIPEYIAGDLDSVYKDVQLFYESEVSVA